MAKRGETYNGALCDLRVAPDRRVRRTCPLHKKREMAWMRQCYDDTFYDFDCGVTLSRYEGYWMKHPRRRHARRRSS